LIRAVGLTAMTRELANNCVLIRLDEESCQLSLEPRLTHLKSPRAEAALEKSLQTHFNRPIKLQIRLEAPEQETPALQIQREKDERQQAAVDEIEQDEGVLALKATFDARIVPGSIKPL
jgi:DNA polymerase-3 subunit gamma/tau